MRGLLRGHHGEACSSTERRARAIAGGWPGWLVLALGFAACDAPPPPASQEPTDRAASSEPAADHDRPGDLATPRAKKGAVVGGEEVRRTVTWPGAGEIDAALRDRLALGDRDEIDGATLPVLVPVRGTESGHLTVGDGWYAFSAKDDGATINVQGSARARVYPGIGKADPPHVVRGQGAFISQNEGIWVVTWIEHGVAYSVELECADPRAPLCSGPERAVEIAQGLGLVGGHGIAKEVQ